MSNSSNASGGVSAITLLGVLFVGLKLGHVIDWSWWLVTLPFYGGFAFIAAAFLLFGLFGLFAMIVTALDNR